MESKKLGHVRRIARKMYNRIIPRKVRNVHRIGKFIIEENHGHGMEGAMFSCKIDVRHHIHERMEPKMK